MTDPLSGRDGTQPVTDGVDALAPPRAARDGEAFGADAVPRDALPAFPSLPVAADHAAVARWMDADAVEARRASGPGRPWIDGETVDAGGTSPGVVREAGPARLLPREVAPHPAPAPRRPVAERAPERPPRPRVEEDEDDDEPVWLRERREEHEFRSQFGEWRAAPAAPMRSAALSPTTVLVLLVLVAIVVLIALG